MGKRHRIIGSEHQQTFAKLVELNCGRHRKHEVFRDFCEMSALSMSNAVDLFQRDKREARYLEIAKRYDSEELARFPQMLGHVVEGLEAGFSDVLGSLFMQLELGDEWKGQFFTPYSVSSLMARMVMGDAKAEIERKQFLLLDEPCVGGGAMVIAAAEALLTQGINYQQHLHVTATDLDETACHMAYIQLSLLHIPAIVYHGNSLWPSEQTYGHWVTPAHVLGNWDEKLRLRRFVESLAELLRTPNKPEPTPQAEPEFSLAASPAPAPAKPASVRNTVVAKRIEQAAQMSLFD